MKKIRVSCDIKWVHNCIIPAISTALKGKLADDERSFTIEAESAEKVSQEIRRNGFNPLLLTIAETED